MKMLLLNKRRRRPHLPVNGMAVSLVATSFFSIGYLVAGFGFQYSDMGNATTSSGQQTATSSPSISNSNTPLEKNAKPDTQSSGSTENLNPHLPKEEGASVDRPASFSAGMLSYGRSQEGRPIMRYVLGEGADVTVIFGGFHGNERNTKGVVENLYAYLQSRPELLAGHKVVLVPCANPDGWEAKTRVNANGVDINRNFSYHWQPSGRSTRVNPGPSALSESESQAIVALIKKYSPTKVVSIHCPMHCLNWNGELGHNIAKAMHAVSTYRMTGDIGYPTPGSFGEYCEKHLKIGVVTLELPDCQVEEAWQENRATLLAAITYNVTPTTENTSF